MSVPGLAPPSLTPTHGGIVDINQLPVIRRTIPASDVALTPEQAAAYQKGEIDFQVAPPPPPQPMLNPATPQAPQAPTPPQGPVANTTPIPLPAQPPIAPGDTRRVQDRINDLYGKWKTAEERAAGAEDRFAALLSRFEARLNQPPTPPYTNQYGSYPGSPTPDFQPAANQFDPGQAPAPAAGNYITRAEMQALLFQNSQAAAQVAALSNAHVVSRIEAERRFPDVVNNPELKAAADEIWSLDRSLHGDPRGPEKAFALARGLFYNQSAPAPTAQVPMEMRKAGLAALGPSAQADVTAGGPESREAQYQAALDYARRTGRMEDHARALSIKRGY